MIQMWGRNGKFNYNTHSVFVPRKGSMVGGDIHIGFQSKKIGKNSPITIMGPKDEINNLLITLLYKINKREDAVKMIVDEIIKKKIEDE